MSVWTTKSCGRDRKYIVMKHTLRGVNYIVNGIRFRDSYAVVEKDSKTYRNLKQIPVLKAAQEFPLTFLRQLKFITRPIDIRNVFGADVYVQYLRELEEELAVQEVEQKVVEEIKHVEELNLCSFKTQVSGGEDLCKDSALEHSPSGYCRKHILLDPRLLEFGIEIPKFIPRKEKGEWKDKVLDVLQSLKKEGKF